MLGLHSRWVPERSFHESQMAQTFYWNVFPSCFFFFQIHLHQGMNIKFGTASALFDIFFFLVSHISF